MVEENDLQDNHFWIKNEKLIQREIFVHTTLNYLILSELRYFNIEWTQFHFWKCRLPKKNI